MAKIYYSNNLAEEYSSLYRSCETKETHYDEIDELVDRIINHRSRYGNVSDTLGISLLLSIIW